MADELTIQVQPAGRTFGNGLFQYRPAPPAWYKLQKYHESEES